VIFLLVTGIMLLFCYINL
jgi:hypothetical protein